MPQYNHAFPAFNKELMARAVGRDMAISTKQAIEICNYLRRRKLAQAKKLLEEVTEKRRAIPFKKFTDGVGHRRGKMAAGRFPVKASTAILKLLESAEANAQTKGLNTGQLEIVHICANKAHSPVHYGRHHGREFKRTHVEVVVQEAKEEKKSTKPSKPSKKADAPAAKPAEKQPEPKKEEAKPKPEAPKEEKKEDLKPTEEKKPEPEPKAEEKPAETKPEEQK